MGKECWIVGYSTDERFLDTQPTSLQHSPMPMPVFLPSRALIITSLSLAQARDGREDGQWCEIIKENKSNILSNL